MCLPDINCEAIPADSCEATAFSTLISRRASWMAARMAILVLILSAVSLRATVLYVDAANGNNSGFPNDPSHAWNSIGTAVDDLLLWDEDDLPDVIRIAPGVYHDDGLCGGKEAYPIRLNDDPTHPGNDITLIGWVGGVDGNSALKDQVIVESRLDIPAPEDTMVVVSRGTVRIRNITFRGPGKQAAPEKTSRAFDLGPPIPANPVEAWFENVVIANHSLEGILLKSSAIIRSFRNVTIQDNGLHGLATDIGIEIHAFENVASVRNGKSGIYVRGNLKGDLTACGFVDNGEHGILTEGSLTGNIVDCDASRNQLNGLSIVGALTGDVIDTVVCSNLNHGARIQGNMAGDVRRCRFGWNGGAGLLVRSEVDPSIPFGFDGSIRASQFLNNGQHGMRISGNFRGSIREAVFRKNTRDGIEVGADWTGGIRDSAFVQNGYRGAELWGQVDMPELAGCGFRDNTEEGLLLVSGALSTARIGILDNCAFVNNGHAGLQVLSDLSVTNGITRCLFSGNGEGGLTSSGSLWANMDACSFVDNSNHSVRNGSVTHARMEYEGPAFQDYDTFAGIAYRITNGVVELWGLDEPSQPVKLGGWTTNVALSAHATDGRNQRFLFLCTTNNSGVWLCSLTVTNPVQPHVRQIAQVRAPGEDETAGGARILVNELKRHAYVLFRDGMLYKIDSDTGAALGTYATGLYLDNCRVVMEADYEREMLYLLSADNWSGSQTLRIIDALQDGNVRLVANTPAGTTWLPPLLNADSKRQVLFLHRDGYCEIVDVSDPSQPKSITGFESSVDAAYYDGAARRLITSVSYDQSGQVWDVSAQTPYLLHVWRTSSSGPLPTQAFFDPARQRIVGEQVLSFTQVGVAIEAHRIIGSWCNNLFLEQRQPSWQPDPVVLSRSDPGSEFHLFHNAFWGNRYDVCIQRVGAGGDAMIANNVFGASLPLPGSTAIMDGLSDDGFRIHNNIFYNREVILYNDRYAFDLDDAGFYYPAGNVRLNREGDPQFLSPTNAVFKPSSAGALAVNRGRYDDPTNVPPWTLPLLDRAGVIRPSNTVHATGDRPDVGMFEWVTNNDNAPRVATFSKIAAPGNEPFILAPLHIEDETPGSLLVVAAYSDASGRLLQQPRDLIVFGEGSFRQIGFVLSQPLTSPITNQVIVRDWAGNTTTNVFRLDPDAETPHVRVSFAGSPVANGNGPLQLGALRPGDTFCLQVENWGSGELGLAGLAVSGPFAVEDGLASALAPDASDSVTLRYAPYKTPDTEASISFITSDYQNTQFSLDLAFAPPAGSLTVAVLPPEAAAAGIHWRRVGTTQWRASGTTETDLQPGDYSVEFTPVLGWVGPSALEVTVAPGDAAEASATFAAQATPNFTGELAIQGDSAVFHLDLAGQPTASLVLEHAQAMGAPTQWLPVTNALVVPSPGGQLTITLPLRGDQDYFRARFLGP